MSEILRSLIIVYAVLVGALTVSAGLIWLERRLLGLWQDRYGPNRAGPFGLMQVVADMIKIFFKEDWVPPFADRPVFVVAPAIVMITTLAAFAVIPFAPGIVVANLNIGLLFFLAMSSLSVYSVVLGGWASQSKYALLGSLRATAQLLSYEVFMGLSLLGVVMLAGSFNLSTVVEAQRGLWFCIPQFPASGDISDRRPGRDPSVALRHPGSRKRTGGRLPHRILRHEVRLVFRGGIPGHNTGFGHDRDPVFRRVARTRAAADRLVFGQNLRVYLRLHSVSGRFAAAALRPAHGVRLEGAAAAVSVESGGGRRGAAGPRLKSKSWGSRSQRFEESSEKDHSNIALNPWPLESWNPCGNINHQTEVFA
jgi:hypothetical protein